MSTPALENVRRITAWSRQNHGDIQAGENAPKIASVGIIGAGLMGTSIAAAHVRHGLPVVIHDANQDALAGVVAAIAAELRETDGHSTSESLIRRVRPTADVSEAARCDLVLESIVEVLSAKMQLYSQLQPHLAAHAILASNTSTIPIQRLANGLADASRFCGLHFCHPVPKRPLVEIVRGPQTSDFTIAALVAHVRRIDRIAIVVQDGPGFVVNRLLFPYLGEALQLLREGASIESIERAAADFGMALGPLRLMDEIGLDTTLQAAWVLSAAFPDRIVSSPVLVSMVKAGRLGQKSGAGFFSYDSPKGDIAHGVVDPAVATIIAPWIDPTPPHDQTTIAHRLVLPMLLEAARILEEGKAGDARDIDLAMLFGLGFPAEKGGLLWWADTLGAKRIVTLLSSLRTLGPRAEPTPMLKAMAAAGGRFYTFASD